MRKIKLTRGKYAIVDDEDFELLNQYRWNYGYRGYAGTKSIDNKFVYMHRFILKAKDGKSINHINGNGLDNRKSNLEFRQRGKFLRISKKVNCSVCGKKLIRKTNMAKQFCDICNHKRYKERIQEYLQTNKAKYVRRKYQWKYTKEGKRRKIMKNRREARRQRALDNLSRECFVCGYKKYDCSLDIHHIEPEGKKRTGDPEWWRLDFNDWNIFVVLCRNCHHAYHKGLIERSW